MEWMTSGGIIPWMGHTCGVTRGILEAKDIFIKAFQPLLNRDMAGERNFHKTGSKIPEEG